MVDQSEYLTMVEDMAELRRSKRDKLLLDVKNRFGMGYLRNVMVKSLSNYFAKWGGDEKNVNNGNHKDKYNGEESLEVLEIDDIYLDDQSVDFLDADEEELLKHSSSIKIPQV